MNVDIPHTYIQDRADRDPIYIVMLISTNLVSMCMCLGWR